MLECSHFRFARLLPLFLIGSAVPAFAAVVHDFSGGDGTSNSTQYTGAAGNGWAGPFAGATEGATTAYTVGNANPLVPGGGNYLQRSVTGAVVETGSTRRGSVHRKYTSTTDFNATQAHTISFLWRADEIGTGFNSTGDYFVMFGSTGTAGSDTGATSTWMIRYQGANEGGLVAGNFAVYNGDKGVNTAYSAVNWVNSGIPVQLGTAYLFTIQNDPVTATWSVNIQAASGGTSYQSADLGWRAAANPNSSSIAWGAKVTAVDERLTFSVDSINIVPEPSSLGLTALGALALATRRRKN